MNKDNRQQRTNLQVAVAKPQNNKEDVVKLLTTATYKQRMLTNKRLAMAVGFGMGVMMFDMAVILSEYTYLLDLQHGSIIFAGIAAIVIIPLLLFFLFLSNLINDDIAYLYSKQQVKKKALHHSFEQTKNQIETTNYSKLHLFFGWRYLFNPDTGYTSIPLIRLPFLPSVLFTSLLLVLTLIYITSSPSLFTACIGFLGGWLISTITVFAVNYRSFKTNLNYEDGGLQKYLPIYENKDMQRYFYRLFNHLAKESYELSSKDNSLYEAAVLGKIDFEKGDSDGIWAYKLACKQQDIYKKTLLKLRLLNYAISKDLIDISDYKNEIALLYKIKDKDMPQFFKSAADFFCENKDNDKENTNRAFKESVEAACIHYIENAEQLFTTIDSKLTTDYQIAQNKMQISIMNHASLDDITNIALTYSDDARDYHALEFNDLEKRVVAKNLVTGMLPELKKSLEIVQGNDEQLEQAIVAQIARVNAFIKRLAVDDKSEDIEAQARLIDAHSRHILELGLPDTLDDISNQLAINDRYLDVREDAWKKP